MAFGDESGFTENPPPTYAWAPKAKPHAHQMKTGDRKRLNAIGCCDFELRPLSVWFFEGTAKSSDFRSWASDFASRCDPKKPTHLWLDNGALHTAQATRKCFEAWAEKGLLIHFLPPYGPEFNRVEILWRKLKRLRPFALLELVCLRKLLKSILRQLYKS